MRGGDPLEDTNVTDMKRIDGEDPQKNILNIGMIDDLHHQGIGGIWNMIEIEEIDPIMVEMNHHQTVIMMIMTGTVEHDLQVAMTEDENGMKETETIMTDLHQEILNGETVRICIVYIIIIMY